MTRIPRSTSIVTLLSVALSAAALMFVLAGCQSTYYAAMEQFGVHKRDILVDRVEEAREDQEDAKEAFQTALERFTEVVQVDGGDLRKRYDKLNSQLERCQSRAQAVNNRISSIENVADDLFSEWQAELEDYSSDELRRKSEQTMYDTRSRYDQLVAAMKRAESRMPPVLTAFNDQVLFLKHNLNAQAIASLEGEVDILQSEVASLIAEMNAAIAEANEFINDMSAPA